MKLINYPITQWLILGSFPNKNWEKILDKSYISEATISPSEGDKTAQRQWQAVQSGPEIIDLLRVKLTEYINCVAYAFCYVHCAENAPAKLLLGSDDGIAAIINGKHVWSNNLLRPVSIGEDIVSVKLKKGWNRLLLKISQRDGNWGFAASIKCAAPLCIGIERPDLVSPALRNRASVVVLESHIDLDHAAGQSQARLSLINSGGKPATAVTVSLGSGNGKSLTRKVSRLASRDVASVSWDIPLADLAGILAEKHEVIHVQHDGQSQSFGFAASSPLKVLLDSLKGDHAAPAVRSAMERLQLLFAIFPKAMDSLADEARRGLAALATADHDGVSHAINAMSQRVVEQMPNEKSKVAQIVGHAHIDMNWLWTWQETVQSCQDSFRQVIAFMDEFPDFTFMQSQPSAYKAVEHTDPVLFERIKQRVAEGRWELGGGMFSEGDTNMSSGEAIARTFLLGQGYFQSRFGKTTKVGWLPDNFGHVSQLPQILQLAGCEFFYFHRCRPYLGTFWWQGVDGSKVLCFANHTYNGTVNTELQKDFESVAQDKSRLLMVVGVGDHGGGPTRKDIENAHLLDGIAHFPSVKFSSAEKFFRDSVDGVHPTHRGEMQYIFEGCYTSIAAIKEGNRRCEAALYSAEVLASLLHLAGREYPAAHLRETWEIVTFNQFHDILCGSAIHESNADSVADYKWALSRAEDVRDKSLRALADQVKADRSKGQPIVVFNPHPRPQTTLVEAELFTHDAPATAGLMFWGDPYGASKVKAHSDDAMPSVVLRDPSGKSISAQIVSGKNFPPGYRWRVQFVADEIPAGGYRTYYVDATQPSPDAKLLSHKDGTFVTDYLKVDIDLKTGDIKGIFDKRAGRQLVAKNRGANALRIYMEEPHGMSAWTIGPISKTIDVTDVESVQVLERGPVRACVEVVKTWNRSKFIQRIYIYKSYPRIDFELEAHWFEQGSRLADSPMLRAIFPLGLKKPTFNSHVPFDVVSRTTAGQEVPAQQWVDVSDGKSGIALLNQTKYGHSMENGELRLTLLRSSYDPDIYPDQGLHRIRYSLFPHEGDWKQGVWNEGDVFNKPMLATEPPSAAMGPINATRPEEASLFAVEPANVVLSGMKEAEAGKEMIIRIAEIEGSSGVATVTLPWKIHSARRLDLLERPIDAAAPTADGHQVSVAIKPHEIVTLGLKVTHA